MEIIMTKKLNKTLILSFLAIILALSSFLLIGCGDDTITNISALNGIVKDVSVTKNNETSLVNGVSITFVSQPANFSATYQGQTIKGQLLTKEDYYDDNTLVTAYIYVFTMTDIAEEEYNQNPIVVSCDLSGNSYRFNLTTNLLQSIYPQPQDNAGSEGV